MTEFQIIRGQSKILMPTQTGSRPPEPTWRTSNPDVIRIMITGFGMPYVPGTKQCGIIVHGEGVGTATVTAIEDDVATEYIINVVAPESDKW